MKIKDIKPTEWAIGIGVALLTYLAIRNFNKVFSGTEINGVRLSDKDKKKLSDTDSEKIIQKLHPKFRNLARAFVNRVKNKLGLTVFLTSGYRTFERQQQLYNENKNNARPGYSSHNYGFAIDVNVKDKKGNLMLTKSSSDKKWIDSGVLKIANQLGMKWGGGGSFGAYHDPVHFYISPKGKTTQELLAEHKAGNVDSNGYVNV